jgi:hypothetical protein
MLVPLAGILAALVFAVPPVRAQQPSPPVAPPGALGQPASPSSPPSPPGAQKKPKAPGPTTKELQTGTSNERLFGVVPDFLLIDTAKSLPPLSPGAKFKVAARNSFDHMVYPMYGILAGLSQAENSERGYGQGAAGYGKRYGAAFADGTLKNFMTDATLPSILRQDPRYYQLGNGGFWRRTTYAVSRIFITRSDSGKPQFNYSEILGSALAANISTYSYHPRNQRTVGNSLSVCGTQIGYATIYAIISEFWPDMHRHVSKK